MGFWNTAIGLGIITYIIYVIQKKSKKTANSSSSSIVSQKDENDQMLHLLARPIKYIRIVQKEGPLVLAQVTLLEKWSNINEACYGFATQSSTLNNDLMKHGPQLAIAGSHVGEGFNDYTSTSDVQKDPAWWELRLNTPTVASVLQIQLPAWSSFPRPNNFDPPSEGFNLRVFIMDENREILQQYEETTFKENYNYRFIKEKYS